MTRTRHRGYCPAGKRNCLGCSRASVNAVKEARQAPFAFHQEDLEYEGGFEPWEERDLCTNCGRPLYRCRCDLLVTLTLAQWSRLDKFTSAKLRECSADAVDCETAPIELDVPSVENAPSETSSTRMVVPGVSTAAVKTSTR